MGTSEKRPRSTALLVGLILLVTVGTVVTMVPLVECPLRHAAELIGNDVGPYCPDCGGTAKRVTLWRKWTRKPQTMEDQLEWDHNKRPMPPAEKK
jgi:hypothetical protein